MCHTRSSGSDAVVYALFCWRGIWCVLLSVREGVKGRPTCPVTSTAHHARGRVTRQHNGARRVSGSIVRSTNAFLLPVRYTLPIPLQLVDNVDPNTIIYAYLVYVSQIDHWHDSPTSRRNKLSYKSTYLRPKTNVSHSWYLASTVVSVAFLKKYSSLKPRRTLESSHLVIFREWTMVFRECSDFVK